MPKANVVIIAKALLFWVIFTVLVKSGGFFFPVLPQWAMGITAGGFIGAVMVLVTWIFLKSDTLTLSDIGMTFGKDSLKRLVLSLAVGVAFFGCFYLAYLWLTPVMVVSVSNLNVFDAVVIAFFALLMLSVMEEVAFRGYLLKKLESVVGIRGAIYVTSIAFGLYHGLTVDSLTGPAVWGLWYGVLAYWSKGLAIPIGFHAGVNLVQALFSQKERWASGFWTFDVVDKATPLTIEQLTIGIQGLLFIGGVALVEIYLAKVRKADERSPPVHS